MNINIKSTELAKDEALNIKKAANSYASIISTLRYLQLQINENWQGEASDIKSINLGITNSIKQYNEKIIPALEKLGNGLISYAIQNEKTANNSVNSTGLGVGATAVGAVGAVGVTNLSNTSSSTTVSTNTVATKNSFSVSLPSGVDSSTTTYMNWNKITSKSSPQYKFRQQAQADNTITCDQDGFYLVNDGKDNRYVVAMTTTYGQPGDCVDVYQANGSVLKCIIGDIKAPTSPGDGYGYGKFGHMYGSTINTLEFLTDWSSGHKNPGNIRSSLDQNVIKVVNTGNTYDFKM